MLRARLVRAIIHATSLPILLGALPATTNADTLVVTPIAVQRQLAPEGGRYILFGDISIDSLRRVTFTASLSNGRIGIFRSRPGTVEPLLMTGDDAPDDAGTAFDTLFEAASNARGDLAFIASTFFPQRAGVFLMRDGIITTVALQGARAPTARGEAFAGFDQIHLLESGDIYFGAALSESPASSVVTSRAIVKATPVGLEPVISPGDRYMGLREVAETLQFNVNQAGEVASLAVITEADLLQPDPSLLELILFSSGRLSTLASVNLSVSGGIDLVRTFAFTFNQVNINDAGETSFFASTNNFFLGAYFVNRTGGFLTNTKLLSEGDPSPVSPGDLFRDLGAFGFNSTGTLIFHALTRERRAGGLFVRRGGTLQPVALVGDPRPDGAGVWHGFLQVDLNEGDAFAFTDFQDIVQVGLFLGRFVPAPDAILAELRDIVRAAGLDRGLTANLLTRLEAIARSLARGDESTALRQAESLQGEVQSRSGHSLPVPLADQLDLKLQDLVVSLGGPTSPGPS